MRISVLPRDISAGLGFEPATIDLRTTWINHCTTTRPEEMHAYSLSYMYIAYIEIPTWLGNVNSSRLIASGAAQLDDTVYV